MRNNLRLIENNNESIKNSEKSENLDKMIIMAKGLLIANKTINKQKSLIKKLRKENKKLKEKNNYFYKLINTNLLLSLKDVAKEIGIGERDIIKFLLKNKILFRDKDNQLKPYSIYMKKEYFEIKEIYDINLDKIFSKVFVTLSGMEFILKILEKNKIIK